MKYISIIIFTFGIALNTNAKSLNKIMVNTDLLDHLSIPYSSTGLDIAIIPASDKLISKISHHAHDFGRCGGFELIANESDEAAINQLETQKYNQYLEFLNFQPNSQNIEFNNEILDATQLLLADNLKNTVAELTTFKTRSSRGKDVNRHVTLMKSKIDNILAESELNISSELVSHNKTKQNSIKVRIEGYKNPNEVIVLGGHLDSTAFFSAAPGADDNASGSANLLEVLRVLSTQAQQPERSIEIFWYAAEEVGLVGSSEIAKSYKQQQIDVVAVMQLDMTGFAGSGLLNISNITDYTSPWLRDLLVDLNNHYVNAVIHEDKCGYGCSDHASWFRQGFDTVFPIEAKFKQSNKHIHSSRDTMDKLDFEHSLVFAKLALSLAMELANSDNRNPIKL